MKMKRFQNSKLINSLNSLVCVSVTTAGVSQVIIITTIINLNSFIIFNITTKLRCHNTQATYALKNSEFIEVLEAGVWYVGLYNDSPNKITVTFKAQPKG